MESYKIDKTQFEWEKDVSLLNNPFFLIDMLKILGFTFITACIFVILFFLAMNFDFMGMIFVLLMVTMVIGILTVLTVGIVLVFFQNNFRMKFTLTDEMAIVEIKDKMAYRIKLSPSFMEMSSVFWRSVSKAFYLPNKKIISLRNRWRTIITIYCTDENYLTIETYVKGKVYKKIGL